MSEKNIFDKLNDDIMGEIKSQIKVTARIVKLKLDSVFRQGVETSTRGNVSVDLDEENPLVKALKMLLVGAIIKETEEKIIGESNWQVESIEEIELVIPGKFGRNDGLQLP